MKNHECKRRGGGIPPLKENIAVPPLLLQGRRWLPHVSCEMFTIYSSYCINTARHLSRERNEIKVKSIEFSYHHTIIRLHTQSNDVVLSTISTVVSFLVINSCFSISDTSVQLTPVLIVIRACHPSFSIRKCFIVRVASDPIALRITFAWCCYSSAAVDSCTLGFYSTREIYPFRQAKIGR